MSIPQVVFQELRALVADRVYVSAFPQPPDVPLWPAIRYTLVSNEVSQALCGTADEESDDIRVQIDIVASTYAAMRALKAQVIAALETTNPPCSRQSGFETHDAETKTHRVTMDFLFQLSTVP